MPAVPRQRCRRAARSRATRWSRSQGVGHHTLGSPRGVVLPALPGDTRQDGGLRLAGRGQADDVAAGAHDGVLVEVMRFGTGFDHEVVGRTRHEAGNDQIGGELSLGGASEGKRAAGARLYSTRYPPLPSVKAIRVQLTLTVRSVAAETCTPVGATVWEPDQFPPFKVQKSRRLEEVVHSPFHRKSRPQPLASAVRLASDEGSAPRAGCRRRGTPAASRGSRAPSGWHR